MACYTITATVEDTRQASVVKKLKDLYGEGVYINVTKIDDSPSRAARLSEAESKFNDAKEAVQELKEEIDNWKEGLPENLQGSDKASSLEECADALDTIVNDMESVDFDVVEFPSMMG